MRSAEEMSVYEKTLMVESYANYALECGTMKTTVAPRILERLRQNQYPEEYRLKTVVSYRGIVNEDRLLLLDILVEKLVSGKFAG